MVLEVLVRGEQLALGADAADAHVVVLCAKPLVLHDARLPVALQRGRAEGRQHLGAGDAERAVEGDAEGVGHLLCDHPGVLAKAHAVDERLAHVLRGGVGVDRAGEQVFERPALRLPHHLFDCALGPPFDGPGCDSQLLFCGPDARLQEVALLVADDTFGVGPVRRELAVHVRRHALIPLKLVDLADGDRLAHFLHPCDLLGQRLELRDHLLRQLEVRVGHRGHGRALALQQGYAPLPLDLYDCGERHYEVVEPLGCGTAPLPFLGGGVPGPAGPAGG